MAICVLALLIRLYYWPAGLFHTDSVITAMEAERSAADLRLHYLQGLLGYPGYAIVTSAVVLFYQTLSGAGPSGTLLNWGFSEDLLILFSILMGPLSVAAMYHMGRTLTGSRHAGAYAAFILAFMPLHITLSTYVKDQIFGSIFQMAALTAAYHAGNSRTLRSKIAAALLLGYSISIRQQEFLLYPAFLILYFSRNPFIGIKKSVGSMTISLTRPLISAAKDFALLALLPPAVFFAAFIPRKIYQPGYSVIESFMHGGGEQVGGFSLLSPLMVELSIPWAILTLTWFGIGLLFWGLLVGIKKDMKTTLAMASWMFPYFFILGNFAHLSPYFIFPAFLPAAFFMGWGLKDIRLRFGSYASNILVLTVTFWMLTSIHPVLSHRSQYCGPCEFAKRIGEVTPKGSYVSGADETRHYEYYGHRSPQPIPRPNFLDPAKTDEYLDFFEKTMENGTRMYVTTMDLYSDHLPDGLLGLNPDNPDAVINVANGRVYDNVGFDQSSGVFIDSQYGTKLPIIGIYGVELANRFRIVEVFSMENEVWHHMDLKIEKYESTLYELVRR